MPKQKVIDTYTKIVKSKKKTDGEKFVVKSKLETEPIITRTVLHKNTIDAIGAACEQFYADRKFDILQKVLKEVAKENGLVIRHHIPKVNGKPSEDAEALYLMDPRATSIIDTYERACEHSTMTKTDEHSRNPIGYIYFGRPRKKIEIFTDKISEIRFYFANRTVGSIYLEHWNPELVQKKDVIKWLTQAMTDFAKETLNYRTYRMPDWNGKRYGYVSEEFDVRLQKLIAKRRRPIEDIADDLNIKLTKQTMDSIGKLLATEDTIGRQYESAYIFLFESEDCEEMFGKNLYPALHSAGILNSISVLERLVEFIRKNENAANFVTAMENIATFAVAKKIKSYDESIALYEFFMDNQDYNELAGIFSLSGKYYEPLTLRGVMAKALGEQPENSDMKETIKKAIISILVEYTKLKPSTLADNIADELAAHVKEAKPELEKNIAGRLSAFHHGH